MIDLEAKQMGREARRDFIINYGNSGKFRNFVLIKGFLFLLSILTLVFIYTFNYAGYQNTQYALTTKITTVISVFISAFFVADIIWLYIGAKIFDYYKIKIALRIFKFYLIIANVLLVILGFLMFIYGLLSILGMSIIVLYAGVTGSLLTMIYVLILGIGFLIIFVYYKLLSNAISYVGSLHDSISQRDTRFPDGQNLKRYYTYHMIIRILVFILLLVSFVLFLKTYTGSTALERFQFYVEIFSFLLLTLTTAAVVYYRTVLKDFIVETKKENRKIEKEEEKMDQMIIE